MKRIFLLMCTILLVQTLSAQVVNFDMIERNANTDVKLTLKDLKSSKPVAWASVYLIPTGDTTITHFALSDDKGDVLLKEVVWDRNSLCTVARLGDTYAVTKA